jgi:hypothetical protein
MLGGDKSGPDRREVIVRLLSHLLPQAAAEAVENNRGTPLRPRPGSGPIAALKRSVVAAPHCEHVIKLERAMPHGHLVVRSANRLEEFFAAELSRLDPLAVQIDGFPVSDDRRHLTERGLDR